MNVCTVESLEAAVLRPLRHHLGDPASEDEIRRLYRSAFRYQFAAEQNRHPIVAFLHNSYAVSLVEALRSLASDEEVSRAIGTDFRAFRAGVLDLQDTLQKRGEEILASLRGSDILKRLGLAGG